MRLIEVCSVESYLKGLGVEAWKRGDISNRVKYSKKEVVGQGVNYYYMSDSLEEVMTELGFKEQDFKLMYSNVVQYLVR